ncbi:FA81A protein, partial [Atractosteus spatula]|nr:FA81A protein [Atractosteus spatula]
RPRSSGRSSHSVPHEALLPAAARSHAGQSDSRSSPREKATAALVEQALHLQEEIVAGLRGALSRDWGDQAARRLLEEHIFNITAIVRRMNTNIEILREQIRTRDGVACGTNTAVRSLELHQVSTLGDLRGRIARCDASIARLSADIRSANEQIQSLSKDQQLSKAALESQIKDVDVQISVVYSKIEQSAALQEAKIKASQGDTGHQLHLLDTKLKIVSDELKGQMMSIRTWLEKEQENTAKEVIHKIEELSGLIKTTIDSNDRIVEEKYNQLSAKLDKIEETQKMNMGLQRVKHAEEKLNARITKIEKQLWEEVENMRAETNTGFAAIHESLGSLRLVLEAKLRLEKEQLQKQIAQVKRRARPS